MHPLLYTVSGAARLLGLSRHTVSDMIRKGELDFIPWRSSKIHKRIPHAVIMEWIRKHTLNAVSNREELRDIVDKRRQ